MEIHLLLHRLLMRTIILLILLFTAGDSAAQVAKSLPEFVFIPTAADAYEWKRVLVERPRTLFNNAVAVTDSTQWSFGGFNTQRVQRVLYRIEGRHLVNDSITYPGAGFMNNLFFAHDSMLFIGGGLDSGAARYSYQDFWRYDLRKRSWARLPDLPFYNMKPLSVFQDDNRILVLVMALRGQMLDEARPVCYSYDLAAATWKVVSKPLPLAEFGGDTGEGRANYGLSASAFRIGDALYVLLQPWEASENRFFRLDLESGEWSRPTPFPARDQNFMASFAFSDGAFGFVGAGRKRQRAGNSRQVFRYDPVRDKWERIADLPQGVRYAKGWNYHGEHYVGFGINDKDETVMIWRMRRKR